MMDQIKNFLFGKKDRTTDALDTPQPLREGLEVKGLSTSAFVTQTPQDEQKKIINEVVQGVNEDQREIVRRGREQAV